jgi:hypothetical protein
MSSKADSQITDIIVSETDYDCLAAAMANILGLGLSEYKAFCSFKEDDVISNQPPPNCYAGYTMEDACNIARSQGVYLCPIPTTVAPWLTDLVKVDSLYGDLLHEESLIITKTESASHAFYHINGSVFDMADGSRYELLDFLNRYLPRVEVIMLVIDAD